MPEKPELVPGTLIMLVLRVLRTGPLHGYAISQRIRQVSGEVLQVEEGSLYPALQRMLMKGWVKAEWGISAENRRARYYRLTTLGREQMELEVSQFERVMQAIHRVISPADTGS